MTQRKFERIKLTKEAMANDAQFIANFLSELPNDTTHNELFGLAVEVLVADCSRVKKSIWQRKGEDINVDLLQDRTLSSGERLIAEAAISVWTTGVSSVNLWTILNKLDLKNSRNFMRALGILHYWDAAEREMDDREADRISKFLQEDSEE
jgi:hypothetical protein